MNSLDTSTRREKMAKTFRVLFGGTPNLWVRAPGRVDLMGSHTDYNLGYVLTMPIDRDTWIAARARPDRQVNLFSVNLESDAVFSLDDLTPDSKEPWSNYVRGVAQVLQEEGYHLSGFDGLVHSTVPIRSGLSSSAALECAAATLFEALCQWRLEPARKAQLCQRAENHYVGVNCGILDQYTSCAGRQGCALLLDCCDLSSRSVRLPDQLKVVICDTKSRRELAGSEYGQRRGQCEEGARRLGVRALREVTLEHFNARKHELPQETAKRCQFILEENDRVLKLVEALDSDDRSSIQRLTAASFQGACDLYEIAAPAMHAMMESMLAGPGVIGARQAGAGFGGCMVAFVEKARADAFAAAVRQTYFSSTGTEPEIYAVEAAAGAGLV